ncbi:MAG TPA: hypothetical protein VLJ10_03415, partial [Candidatus Bathyarchaeia archaeon]|nr:hypothetical protein [Candidatus Bathyarchaeia archaeon]
DKSKVIAAADAVISGLPGALKTGVDFSKMTPEQRVNWVLNSVEEKVKGNISDKIQDTIKDKMQAYAKEAIRAKAFMDIGVPQIKHAYAMGQTFDWAKIDAEIASRADTNFNKLNAGIKAAQISWDTIQAYRQGDFSAAARTLGGEISGMLAEAYIPGYGYIKAGAAMVEFLGNYVLDYATDTAVEGMLNDMYGKKSNPQGLAQWLIDKSPSAIMADINQKFDDGMGFGYLFRGQGTDKGDEEMKARIQSELVGLRSQLVTQMKEQERREQQAQAEIDRYLQKYKEAEKALRAEAEKARADIESQLAPVTEFKKQVNALYKQDVRETIAEIKKQESDVGSGEGVAYTPFSYGGLISEFQAVYSEIKDTPSGYDYEATTRMWSAYYKNRAEALKKVSEANQQNCRQAMKQVDDQYLPRLNSLLSQHGAEKDGGRRQAIYAQYEAVRNEYSAAQMTRGAACNANGKRLGIEISTFYQEESIVRLDAQERADRLHASIQQGYERIIDGIKQAKQEYDTARKSWNAEIQQTFAYPGFFITPGSYDQSTAGSSVSGIAREIQNGNLQVYSPGDLHNSRERVIEAIEKIKKDQTLISRFSAQERDITVKYQTEILKLKNEFESLVPANLRGEGSSRTQEMEDYQKEEDERVAKYGSSAGSSEEWGITRSAFVRFGALPKIPSVENPRYFDKTLAELQALEQARGKKFRDAQQAWEQELQTIDFYADLDRIAVSIMSLNKNINGVLGRFLGVYPNFRMKDGKESIFVKAEESDGAKMLKEMKEAWEAAKPYVERMRKNVAAYGKGIKYISSINNPKDAINRLPHYEAVPGQIAAHEKRMADQEQQRLSSLTMVEEELAKLKADIESLKDPGKVMFYPTTLRQLRAMFDQIFRIIKIDGTRSAFKEEYETLRDEMEEYVKEHEAAARKRAEEYKRQQEADAARARAEAESKRREAEALGDRMINESGPFGMASYYGYAIENPRLNSRSMADARGDVILSKTDLIAGEMIVEARLFTIDKAQTILLSDDGGRTWKEQGLSQNINFRFTPLPDRAYDFVLRIKTTDNREPQVRLFTMVNSIIYRDVDFDQLIVETVKMIADAYEQANITVFSNHVSQDYLGNKAVLEEGVRFDFDMFINIRLTIYVNRIQQRGDMFVVETKWDKTQTPRKTGEEQRTSGKTTFTFVLEEGKMRIKNLRGDLIYATLSPEIAQASGKSSSVVDEIRTARDDRNPTQPGAGTTEDSGGVTTSSDDDEVASITVTSPNGGESWPLDSEQTITWTSSGVVAVHIEYSEGEGGGIMWNDVVASTPANTGSYSWNTGLGSPGPSQVRITAVEDPTVTDTSDATFTLTAP